MIRLLILLLTTTIIAGCCSSRYGCDYWDRPNWDSRHQKFNDWLDIEVGKKFPTPVMCSNNYISKTNITKSLVEYEYGHGEGCKYYCEVDVVINSIINTHFDGSKQTCTLSLN